MAVDPKQLEQAVAQLATVITPESQATLTTKISALAPQVLALNNPATADAARATIRAEKAGILEVLEKDEKLKDSKHRDAVITQARETLDALSLEQEQEREAAKKRAATNAATDPMALTLQGIIMMILVMLGVPEEQVNKMFGKQEEGAAKPAETPAAATPAQPAAAVQNTNASMLTNTPPPQRTPGENALANVNDKSRHEGIAARQVAALAQERPDLMVRASGESVDQIKTRLQTGLTSGVQERSNARKDYYAAAAEHSALLAIKNNSSMTTSYAVEDLEIWNYTGIEAEIKRARNSERSHEGLLTSANAAYDTIGLNVGKVQFEKGDISDTPVATSWSETPAVKNARLIGAKEAEQMLLDSYSKGVAARYDQNVLAGRQTEVKSEITTAQQSIAKDAAEKERLLAEIGMHRARIDLNAKLESDGNIGQTYTGQPITSWFGYSAQELSTRATDAITEHKSQMESAEARLATLEGRQSENVLRLVDLYKEEGKLKQQMEYATGANIVKELDNTLGAVNAELKRQKDAEDQRISDAKIAADNARMDRAFGISGGAPAGAGVGNSAPAQSGNGSSAAPYGAFRTSAAAAESYSSGPFREVNPMDYLDRNEKRKLEALTKQLVDAQGRVETFDTRARSRERVGDIYKSVAAFSSFADEKHEIRRNAGLGSDSDHEDYKRYKSERNTKFGAALNVHGATVDYLGLQQRNAQEEHDRIVADIRRLEDIGRLRGERKLAETELNAVNDNLKTVKRAQGQLSEIATAIQQSVGTATASPTLPEALAREAAQLAQQANYYRSQGYNEVATQVDGVRKTIADAYSNDRAFSPQELEAIRKAAADLSPAMHKAMAKEAGNVEKKYGTLAEEVEDLKSKLKVETPKGELKVETGFVASAQQAAEAALDKKYKDKADRIAGNAERTAAKHDAISRIKDVGDIEVAKAHESKRIHKAGDDRQVQYYPNGRVRGIRTTHIETSDVFDAKPTETPNNKQPVNPNDRGNNRG